MQTYPSTSRSTVSESMDALQPNLTVLQAEFRLLRRFNALTHAAQHLIDAIEARLQPVSNSTISLIDFGAGIGDIARTAIATTGAKDWHLSVHATDRNSDIVRMCRESGSNNGMTFQQIDILNATSNIVSKSFDVAHSSLMLHHLCDLEVVQALQTMSLCASKLILWNDLLRSPVGIIGAHLTALGSPRVVRRDAVQSVRRGFTIEEAEAFAEAAGLTDIHFSRRIGARFVLCARPSVTMQKMTGRPLLHCEKVSFSYGSRPVLREFSKMLHCGEVGVIKGTNGCGKTTLFRILVGAIQPNSGRAWCDRTQGAIAYLPQQGGLMGGTDLLTNIALTQKLAGTPICDREKRAREAIEQFGMAALASVPISQMSVGQVKRASLATVFSRDSLVYLLDEPEASLDTEGRSKLWAAIQQRARSGCAILLSTHDTQWLNSSTNGNNLPLQETILV